MAAAHLFATRPTTMGLVFACSKKQFSSRYEATRKLKTYQPVPHLVQSAPGVIGVYQCKECRFWHLGHR